MDVVVVGAGPVGLMLACELRLGGARPLVLERRVEPGTAPKGNGLGGQIVHLLDHRGLLERFAAQAAYTGPFPSFPFGSVPLDFTRLDASPLVGMAIPQARTEAILTARAEELGVEIRRGAQLQGLVQDADGVTLDVGGSAALHAQYLVGCDGGHSTVRELAGIGFPGSTDRELLRMGHFRSDDAVSLFDIPDVRLPGGERLQPGWNRTPRGRVVVTSFQPGVHVVGVRELDQDPPDPTAPLGLDEFRASVRRVLGTDLPLGEPTWLSRTVSHGRLAERYRAGRVLLAGDAAHLFPAGGSSLNVGMTDAVNLGWKLAATVGGRAPAGLLDSYGSERRPVGERALLQTRAQAALDRAAGEDGAALRELVGELVAFEEPLRHLGELLQGSDTRYDMPGTHPLLGRFVPDLLLSTSRGATRPAELMRGARPVLLDLTDRAALRTSAQGWTDRVDVVTASAADAPAAALLIRPDGHVAWAGDVGERPIGLAGELTRWFGPRAVG